MLRPGSIDGQAGLGMTETEARAIWYIVGSIVALALWLWFVVWFVRTMNAIARSTEAAAGATPLVRELQETNRWLRQIAQKLEGPPDAAAGKDSPSPSQVGSCPNCMQKGVVGDLCEGRTCRSSGYRFTADKR